MSPVEQACRAVVQEILDAPDAWMANPEALAAVLFEIQPKIDYGATLTTELMVIRPRIIDGPSR